MLQDQEGMKPTIMKVMQGKTSHRARRQDVRMEEEIELEMKTGRCLTYILISLSVGFVIASATMERALLKLFGGYCRPHLASMHRGSKWKFALLRRACKCCFQIHYVRTDSRRRAC